MLKYDQKTIASYYGKMQIETASSNKQIVMMHEKVCSNIKDAIVGDKAKSSERIINAQNILSQLQVALKQERNDETVAGLFHLYDYAYVRLESSSFAEWRDALNIMRTISNTFRELIRRK